MPDKTLHEIANETREATAALRLLLEHQRTASRRRLIWITLLYIPFAMIVSGFVTVTTVSVCFLTQAGNEPPGLCSIMPGYTAVQKNNQDLVREFRILQKRSLRNERRIDSLEGKLK